MMNFDMQVYGPVPSRRLGKSLGVSIIPPKVCSYSCVYCQLGKTNKYTIEPTNYFDKHSILHQINKAIVSSHVDTITFAGDGEPTLSTDLGWLLKECRENFSIPTAVITNGSLIYLPAVTNSLKFADLVLPSVDAGCEKTFKKINCPHKDLDFLKIIKGLINFAKTFDGEIWTETMLVKDFNDSFEEINKISNIITQINPARRFIMTPTRPPQMDVKKPDPERLIYAQKINTGSSALDYTETGDFNSDNFGNLTDALNAIASRHPLRLNQAQSIAKNYDEDLQYLIQSDEFIKKDYNGDIYIIPSMVVNH